ncbi:hypothetical protein HanPSC8_Chr16g0743651 [Helianthus annuus]|nr:hypothetical protein HanPSC8_Chr16g0743651 [Helianthus annuus]
MGWCLISCHYRGDISSVEQGDFFHKTTGDEATKLEVLLQTGGYLLLSSYVYDTCQGIAKQHKSLKPKLGGAVDET